MALKSLGTRNAAMPTRYEYDLDHNGEWRWIAVAESGEAEAISPVGYAHLQDCLHAVALLQVPGTAAVASGIDVPAPAILPRPARDADTPDNSLSRLQRR
jgi:uncharacterized protein YegP (UPF0339 family)